MNDPVYKSIKLAQLWAGLEEVRCRINNDLLPFAAHLAIEDPELMCALDDLTVKIARHFERFELSTSVRDKR